MSTKQSTQSSSTKQVKPNQPSTKTKSSKKAPAKPRQKNLTLKSVQKQFNQINSLSTHVINEETNEVVKYYKEFDQKKIQSLLVEAYEKLTYVHSNPEIEYFTNDEEFISFISYLTIKYFTHFYDELKDSTFEDDISAMDALISTGLYKTILNDVLDGSEVVKVLETMNEFMQAASLAIEAETNSREKVLSLAKSPIIKKKLEANEV